MILEPWCGRKAALHDAGKYGKHTVASMAKLAKRSPSAMRKRMNELGLTPEQAIEYKRTGPVVKRAPDYRENLHHDGTVTLIFAIRLARAYPNDPPTVPQLMARFHVSRATAYRWRSAFLEVLEVEAAGNGRRTRSQS